MYRPDIWPYVPENAWDDESYTFDDVVELCLGNVEYAKTVADRLDWQFPETLIDEDERDGFVVLINGRYEIVEE